MSSMRLSERFRRLSFWNKIGVVGAIASVLAVPLAAAFFLLSMRGTSQPALESQTPDVLVKNSGDSGIAIAEFGEGDVIINPPPRASEEELQAARDELVREIEQNLWTANEHLGLATVLLESQFWPAKALSADVDLVRTRMRDRPFSRDAFLAARTRSELVAAESWEHVDGFYHHLTEGVERTLRGQLESLESVLRMRSPPSLEVCEALEAWAAGLEGYYHVLVVRGELALDDLLGEEEAGRRTLDMRYLQLASAKIGDEALSTRLRTLCADSVNHDPHSLICLTKLSELRSIPDDNIQMHIEIAVFARSFDCPEVARATYRAMIDRFPTDRISVAYAKTGLAQLDNPEHFRDVRGLFVTDFASSSPGHDAGIRMSDVLIGYDDRPINTIDDLIDAIATASVDSVRILVVRGDQIFSVECPRGRLGIEFQQF